MTPISINPNEIERHPLSAAWPNMGKADYQSLTDSIRAVGLIEPIVVFEGMVLDGWHRHLACADVGAEPRYVEFDGADPVLFVIGKHARRNLTPSQVALSVAEMKKWAPHGAIGRNRSATLADLTTTEQMAQEAGVAPRQVERAKAVITKGAEDLVEAVKNGEVPLYKAEAVTSLPKEQQLEAAKAKKPKQFKLPDAVNEPKPDFDQIAAEEHFLAQLEYDQATRMTQIYELLDSDDKLAYLHKMVEERDQEIKRLNTIVAANQARLDSRESDVNWLKAKLAGYEKWARRIEQEGRE